MFQHRATQFDPRVFAIAGHLRAIEKELGGIGRSASQHASAGASAAGNQIAEAICRFQCGRGFLLVAPAGSLRVSNRGLRTRVHLESRRKFPGHGGTLA